MITIIGLGIIEKYTRVWYQGKIVYQCPACGKIKITKLSLRANSILASTNKSNVIHELNKGFEQDVACYASTPHSVFTIKTKI